MRVPVLMRIHVSTIGSRIIFEKSGGDIPRGYYQTIGATADESSELHVLVREYVANDSGGRLLEIDDVTPAELDGRDADIRECCSDPSVPGVWYSSGRAFYSESEEESESNTEGDE